MLMLSISDVIDDDVNLRAPYISMDDNENNDALQLLISDDMVMWGPTQSAKRYKWYLLLFLRFSILDPCLLSALFQV